MTTCNNKRGLNRFHHFWACSLLAVAMVGLTAVVGHAETLDELLAEAMAGNSQTRALSLKADALRAESRFARALPNPTVSLGLANLPLTGLSLNQEPMTQKQVAITQRFPWPGKRELAARMPLAQADGVDAEVDQRLLGLLHSVTTGYVELWYQGERERLNIQLQEIVAELTRSATGRYESGRETQQAVLKGELALIQLAEEKLVIEGMIRKAESRLSATLERQGEKPITADAAPKVPEVYPRNFWLDAAHDSPQRRRLEAMVTGRQAGHALAKKAVLPDVGVKVAYGQREDDDNGRGRDDFISMTFSFPVPLWRDAREESMVASQASQKRAAARSLSGYDASLPHRIDGLLAEMETALSRYVLYRDRLVPKSRQLSEAQVSRYEVGAIGYDAMIKAVTETMRAEVMALRYLKEALVAESALRTLAGLFPEGVSP